jgi:hypothetical protein
LAATYRRSSSAITIGSRLERKEGPGPDMRRSFPDRRGRETRISR